MCTMPNTIKTIHLQSVIEKYGHTMSDKVVAITGTTSGTGYIAAREVAKMGAEVLLLNRPSQRAESSFEQLSTVVPSGTFVKINCDLQHIDSVDAAIVEVKSNYDRLDVLVNNAGVMALEDIATDDGYDIQMHTNVISHFQLFKGLLPLLKKSNDARIVNHTSMARLGGPLKPEYFEKNGGNLGGDSADKGDMSGFSGGRWQRYHQTKLANFVFTYVLNQKLIDHGLLNIMSLVAHPGLSKTNLQVTTEKSGGMDAESEFMKQAQSAEDGATGILRAIMDKDANPGDFFGPKQWTGFPDKLEPEKDLLTQDNFNVFWDGCENEIGNVEF